MISDLERKVKELIDKNHRQGDSINQNLHDINTLKSEAQRLIEKHGDIQRDLIDMKRKNEDLTTQNQRLVLGEQSLINERNALEERLLKANDSTTGLRSEINSFKVELMAIKQEYESKLRELETKDKEIISLRDILKKERELARESELVSLKISFKI